MTRPALVAIGAIGAALAGTLVELGPGAVAVATAVAAVAAMALLAVGRPGAVRVATVSFGAAIVLGRIAIGAVTAPPGDAGAGLAAQAAWSGRVVSVSTPLNGRQRFVLEVDEPAARVEVRGPRFPEVGAGMRVTVSGKAVPPGDDAYGLSLAARGIAASLLTPSIRVDPPDGGVGAAFRWLRGLGDRALRAAVPEPAGGLAAGILLGLRERVDRAVAADFTTTGLSHVVAISGWNIAIVVVALGILLRRLARRPRTIVTLVTVCAYVGVVGATPSVVRAALMAGIVLVARESGRRAAAAAALAWAVVAMLVVDPATVGDVGFRLSAAATAGLLAWGTPLTARIGRITGGRMPAWITETLGVSLAAQAATLPLILVAFGRLSLVSPAANLLVAPLVAPAMGAGAVALAGGATTAAGLPSAVAALSGIPAWVGFEAIILAATAAARVPFASVTVSPPWDAATAILACAAVLLAGTAQGRAALAPALGRVRSAWRVRGTPARPRGVAGRHSTKGAGGRPRTKADSTAHGSRLRRVRPLVATVAVLLVGVGIGAARMPDGRARIIVLDVGQGDAILVEGGHGGRLLVDGGPDPDRLVAALDARIPPWDRRIDLVVLTHPHDDHAGGLPGLVGRYTIGRVVEPGMPGAGPGYGAWRSAVTAGRIPAGTIATGDTLRVDALQLRVLWPDAAAVPHEPSSDGRVVNDSSVVLLGESDGVRFLLAGDAEDDVDPTLVARGLPHVALYKVAHHGSATASSDALLAALAPRIAVVSVGAGNTYGHPNPETLGRLAAHGARVFRTDHDGTVTATIADGRLEVRAEQGAGVGGGNVGGGDMGGGNVGGGSIGGGLEVAGPEVAGPAMALLYHRADDSPRPRGGRRAPPLPGPAAVVPPPRAGRGGGRGLARAPSGRRGPTRGPAARRVGGSPPRHRQDRGVGRRRRRAARERFGVLADRAGPRGARPGRGGAPGHPPRGRCRLRGLVRRGERRGAHRRVRRQAGRPAPRDARRAIRVMGAALPAPRGRLRVGWRDDRRGPGARRAPGGGCLCARGDVAQRGRATSMDGPGVPRRSPIRGRARPRPPSMTGETGNPAAVGLYHGDDVLGLERAAIALGDRVAGGAGSTIRTVRVAGSWRRGDEAEEKAGLIFESVATGSLFGDGTLVIVTDAAALARSETARGALLSAIRSVAPGNALALLGLVNEMGKQPAGFAALRSAVGEAGGEVTKVDLPRDITAWIRETGPTLGAHLDGPAAQELARRIGGLEREKDIDRRALAAAAAAELAKLALYRPDGAVTAADVAAVVTERLPASLFRLIDAIGSRRAQEAVALMERAAATTAPPVLVARIHRRLRELAIARDLAGRGEPKIAIARSLGWIPATAGAESAGGRRVGSDRARTEPDLGKVEWRVDRILDEARRWTDDELAAALEGLLIADAAMKGERSSSERAQRLELTLWVVERVAPR